MGLFWFLVLAVVIVLWKVANGPVHELSYPEFTVRLRSQNVEVQASLGAHVSWPRFLLNILSELGIIELWIFLMTRMRIRRNAPSPGGSANGALG